MKSTGRSSPVTIRSNSSLSVTTKTAQADVFPVRRQPLPKEPRMFETVLPPLEPEPPGPSPDTVLHDVPVDQFAKQRQKPQQKAAPPPIGVSKIAPARVRANPQLAAADRSQQGRPPSASSKTRSSSTLTNFDDEMDEIRRQHDKESEVRSRSTSSLGMSARPQSPGAFNAEDFEEADGFEESTTATGKPIYVPYTPDLRAKLGAATSLHTHVSQKPMVLRDYQMLAEACQRAGRARTEGHAYYKIGELLSKNKRDTLPKSVLYFKRYLNISRRLNDLQGEAKALNCLGIVHYEMGGSNNYHIGLEYHKQHAEIADAAGIFIANTNMGLVHAKLGDHSSSMECHKQALQYAVRAGDKAAESLALANLGQSGTKQGDASTARVCVERHLELVTTLHDDAAACEAYEQLGTLAMERGDFATSSENLLLALDVAMRTGDQEKAKKLRCQVGFVQGMMRVDDQMRTAAGLMGLP
jgi:tetratricopeptide (TPR) repeat protein